MIQKHISYDFINENQLPWYNYMTIQVAGLHDMLTAFCNFINATYLAKLYVSKICAISCYLCEIIDYRCYSGHRRKQAQYLANLFRQVGLWVPALIWSFQCQCVSFEKFWNAWTKISTEKRGKIKMPSVLQ